MATLTNEIKKELRKAGIDTKYISVRHMWCGYSDSYHIEIYDESIDRELVRKVCYRFEQVDRDERTGEILMGGNTYIWVDYCWDIRKKEYYNIA